MRSAYSSLLPTKPDKSHGTLLACISSDRMYGNLLLMEVSLKFLSSVPSHFRALFVAGGIILATASFPLPSSAFAQDASASNAAPSLTGNWQISWTAANGAQRQGTLQIKQDGKKLSGSFQGERGSVSLKGSSDGNQISFTVKRRKREVSFTGTVNGDKMSGTTEQGTSWTATRQQ